MDLVMADAPEADWYSNEAATFGDRVAWAREALPLSQGDLARRLGVKLKTLQSWEDDLAEPRANKLQMLSGLLNVSMTWLLTGEGEGLADAAAADTDFAPLLVELRDLRTRLLRDAERLAVLEKRLRKHIDGAEPRLG